LSHETRSTNETETKQGEAKPKRKVEEKEKGEKDRDKQMKMETEYHNSSLTYIEPQRRPLKLINQRRQKILMKKD
jgi:hypothetical protein